MFRKESLFKDSQIQSAFEKDGFVKIPFLDSNQLFKLVQFYEENNHVHEIENSMHHTTTETQNRDLILKVDCKIKELFIPALEKHMKNYKPLVGCFHIKEPGENSATGIHQDPTFVDETKYISANIWVALHDIDSSNGNLFFVKGSHCVSDSLRVTHEYPVYYDSFSESLRKMSTEVPLKAGEAVIFSNSTIHGATDNLSKAQRVAATLLVCSKDAQWQIYLNNISEKEKPIERYGLNLDTFIDFTKNGQPAKDAFIEKIDYVFPQFSEIEFRKKIGASSNPFFDWFSKLKSRF